MQNHRIRKCLSHLICMVTLFLLMMVFPPVILSASTAESSKSYEVKIIDDASLFSEEDMTKIRKEIEPFTEFGNALVATADKNGAGTVQKLAIQYYDQAFGTEDGAVLLIDMKDREIYWYTEGSLYKKLSVKRAMDITDNVYQYASKKDYALCAEKAFGEATTVMLGGKIAQKMKYYGNALLALILAFFINYIWARKTSFIRSEIEDENRSYRQDMKIVVTNKTFSGKETKESYAYKMREERKRQSSYGGYSDSYSGSSSSYSSGNSSSSYSSGSSSSSFSSGSSSSSSSSHHGGGAGHRF